MMMLCYKMSCPKNYVNKLDYLTSVLNETITIKQDTDVTNPIIILKLETYPEFNYVFLEGFSRFYFVEKVINISDDLWEIHLHVDVLPFIQENQKAFISRQENDYNDYLVDGNRKFTKAYEVEEKTLTNDFFGIQDSSSTPRWLVIGMGVKTN